MHEIQVRVYYEDTDLAGIVYHANHLKFIERGRSEMLRAAGIDQARLKAEEDAAFVVHRIEAEYRAPARYDDLLRVTSAVEVMKRASLVLRQQILRGEAVIFDARVSLALMGPDGRPRRLPQGLARLSSGPSHAAK